MNQQLTTPETKSLLKKLREVLDSGDSLSADCRDSISEEIISALSATLKLPFGEDRIGYLEDLCAAYDDMAPVLADFISSPLVGLTREQKRQIAEPLVRRYASHEPGGRTAVVRILIREDVDLNDYVPHHILDLLIRRAANACLDRTFLAWDVHVNLLGKLSSLVPEDGELQGIIYLRLKEIAEASPTDVNKAADELVSRISPVVIKSDIGSSQFLERWQSVLALLPDEKVNSVPLLSALEDVSPWVRSAAAFGLGLKRCVWAGDRLLEHLARDTDEYVRLRCAWAIGQIYDSSTFWKLIRLRELEHVYCVRFEMIDAIAQFDPARAIELLLADLKDVNPSIRLFGAEDFRKVQWPEETDLEPARKALGILQDTEPLKSVRRTATHSLLHLVSREI